MQKKRRQVKAKMLDVLGSTSKCIGESTMVNKLAAKQIVGKQLPAVKSSLKGLAGKKFKKTVPQKAAKRSASTLDESKKKKTAQVMKGIDPLDKPTPSVVDIESPSSDEDEFLIEENERVKKLQTIDE